MNRKKTSDKATITELCGHDSSFVARTQLVVSKEATPSAGFGANRKGSNKNRFAAEEEKPGDVFKRPRPRDVEEAVEDLDEHLVLPLVPSRVEAAADGLRHAEEHLLALEI